MATKSQSAQQLSETDPEAAPITAEEFAQQLAAAEREAAGLRAKLANIDTAVAEAGRSAMLRTLRDQANSLADRAREERDRAKDDFDQLAFAETLDYGELFNAYLKFKELDRRCGTIMINATLLDSVDPMPNGGYYRDHPQQRRPRCRELYIDTPYSANQYATWPRCIEFVIAARLDIQHNRLMAALADERHTAVAQAEATARNEAVQLADGALDIDHEPTIAELAHAAADPSRYQPSGLPVMDAANRRNEIGTRAADLASMGK